MLRLTALLISMLFLFSCEEEEIIYPYGENRLPGTYEGKVHTFGSLDYDNEEVTAIIEYVGKNQYTLEFQELEILDLPVFNIKIIDFEDWGYISWIDFAILNKDCSRWGNAPNQFRLYQGVFDLTFRVATASGNKTLLFQFNGKKT